MNCGQRSQGVVLVAEEKPTSTTPWWTSASGRPSAIPPPPQVREEEARAEAVQADRAKRDREREKRLIAAQEREQRIRDGRADRAQTALDALTGAVVAPPVATSPANLAAASRVVATECARCGTALDTTAGGQGFSFCLRCGAEAAAPRVATTTTATTAKPLTAETPLGVGVHSTGSFGTARTIGLAGTVAVAERPTVGVSPGLAAVLSFFLPGLGQLVNGQIAKGALLFLASFVLANLWHLSFFILFIGRVIAAIDGYRIASRRRAGGPVSDGEWDLG